MEAASTSPPFTPTDVSEVRGWGLGNKTAEFVLLLQALSYPRGLEEKQEGGSLHWEDRKTGVNLCGTGIGKYSLRPSLALFCHTSPVHQAERKLVI